MINQKTFKSTDAEHAQYNGLITIVRPLTKKEADIDDVGPMFRCRTSSGQEFDAFEDELS